MTKNRTLAIIDKMITIEITTPPETLIGIELIDLVGVGGGLVRFGRVLFPK